MKFEPYSKDNICESSPIKLQVEAFGQWNLVPPKATNELQPPLSNGNPLMDTIFFNEDSKKLATSSSQNNRHPSGDSDRWLSQVEIVTHVGLIKVLRHAQWTIRERGCGEVIQFKLDGVL